MLHLYINVNCGLIPFNTTLMIMNLFYRYSVDLFQDNLISGWCYHRICRQRPVKLRVIADGIDVTEITADNFREDLSEQKVHPSGKCGFRIILPSKVQDADTIEVFAGKNMQPLFALQKKTKGQLINRNDGLLSLMKQRFSSRRSQAILFMHIPKTAGTSFNSFARKIYTEREAISHIEAYSSSEYMKMQQRFSFISGHLNIGSIQAGFDLSTVRLLTILRNPYNHLHSHISWLKQVGADPESVYFKQHNVTFQHLALQIQNQDLSNIEGLKHFVDTMKDVELLQFDNCQTRYFLRDSPVKITISDLDEALGSLQLFSSVGFTENYQEFESCFANDLGISNPSQKNTHLNKSKKKILFDVNDPEVKAILYPLVEVDLKIYEAAEQLFAPE